MKIAAPAIRVRKTRAEDMFRCTDLVAENWGREAADRCRGQFIESLNGGQYAPVFLVAVNDRDEVVGFAAYVRSMLMKGAFDLIWIAVARNYQGCDIGASLTNRRLMEIEGLSGQMIQLVTQKPDFFSNFGFFKLHHLGNEWYLMLKLLTTKVDI